MFYSFVISVRSALLKALFKRMLKFPVCDFVCKKNAYLDTVNFIVQ